MKLRVNKRAHRVAENGIDLSVLFEMRRHLKDLGVAVG
jgi:hypothetical protein